MFGCHPVIRSIEKPASWSAPQFGSERPRPASIREAYTRYVASAPQAGTMTRQRSNWQLKPLGNAHYWATYDQVSIGPDGKEGYSKEVRLLEKMGGQWKMMSVITLPLPKPE